MPSERARQLIRTRLGDEVGRIDKQSARRVALVYPSPYAVGMSSLGYQRIYRAIQALEGISAERVFLDDDAGAGTRLEPPVSYEGLRRLHEFPVLAFSVAYELELAGMVRMLEAAGIAPERDKRLPESDKRLAERDKRGMSAPFVLAGGPLTFSNPLTLAGFADAVVMGEAEEILEPVLRAVLDAPDRQAALARLSRIPHVFVPVHHGTSLLPIAKCDDTWLPAWSCIRTPHAELRNMFLVETERGCSRGCAYCVMRRTTNGGMRVVPKEVVLETIPAGERRVGLVGAAVSDHPRIVEILNALADRGSEVGLSSLRPDRLKPEMVKALARVGYRTVTTALDGASQRLRDLIQRRGLEQHYLDAARLAKASGMDRMKLYLMIGLPTETDEDIDECARFVSELAAILPIALGISPFCSKRNTPLDGMPYAGVDVVQQRLRRLSRALRGRAELRSVSAKWAWVEHVLSQGGAEEGLAVARAVREGGSFAAFKRAFAELGHFPDGRSCSCSCSSSQS